MQDVKEEWLEIPTHPNYMVSNYGHIHNIEKRREVTQHPTNHNDGLKVILYCEGVQTVFQVHRLVASLFLEGYKDDYVVKHRDGDWSYNAVWNLEMDPYRMKRGRPTDEISYI